MPVLDMSRELVDARRLSEGPGYNAGSGPRGKARGGDSLRDVRTYGAILHQGLSGLSVLMGPEALGIFVTMGCSPSLKAAA